MTDRLTDADLIMLRAAIDAMREPQAVLTFVQREVSNRYKLTPADRVDSVSGEIVRGSIPPPLPDYPTSPPNVR
jgi:hypothetical protein